MSLITVLGRQRQADLCEHGLQGEFQDSSGCYMEKSCLEKHSKQTNKTYKTAKWEAEWCTLAMSFTTWKCLLGTTAPTS